MPTTGSSPAVVLVDQLDHQVAPLPVRRRVVEPGGRAADADVGDVDVLADEERPDTASGPCRCGVLDVGDGVGDLDGPPSTSRRR